MDPAALVHSIYGFVGLLNPVAELFGVALKPTMVALCCYSEQQLSSGVCNMSFASADIVTFPSGLVASLSAGDCLSMQGRLQSWLWQADFAVRAA